MFTKKTTRKLLITSGCSWTAGSSKIHQKYVWPIILAKKLDMECVNVGNGGKGNEFIYSSLIDKLCTSKNIGLTFSFFIFKNRGIKFGSLIGNDVR